VSYLQFVAVVDKKRMHNDMTWTTSSFFDRKFDTSASTGLISMSVTVFSFARVSNLWMRRQVLYATPPGEQLSRFFTGAKTGQEDKKSLLLLVFFNKKPEQNTSTSFDLCDISEAAKSNID
jgi:hypothetical protein